MMFLFRDITHSNVNNEDFSLIPIVKLLPNMEELNLNEMQHLEHYIERYINAVIVFVETDQITNLRKIRNKAKFTFG